MRYIIYFLFFSPVFLQALHIGVCIMATGKYTRFVETLITSCEKYFLPQHKKTYFVFTDGEIIQNEYIIRLPQKRLGWPYDTMMRFHVYTNYESYFKDIDFIFAIDADMRFINYIGDEILYTKQNKIAQRVAVVHPGFYNKKREHFSYETNPLSTAHIVPHEGKYYFCGGFWGGSKEGFFDTCKRCIEHINTDLEHNIIAVWHDESHRNRDLIDYPPCIVLGPEYCHPEHQQLPAIFTPRLLALDKNHAEIREEN